MDKPVLTGPEMISSSYLEQEDNNILDNLIPFVKSN